MALLICCSIATLSVAVAEGSDAPDQAGKVHTYRIESKLVGHLRDGRQRDILVYTPPGYDEPENSTLRYPVVYLLHGSPGNPLNYVKLGEIDSTVDRLIHDNYIVPAIIVVPNGNYAGESHGDSEWVNSMDGKALFDDFVAKEVVGWADKTLRTMPSPQTRIIGGVSEGGYGAVNIALKHPDVFGNVLALSGYFVNDGSGWARPIMGHDQPWLDANSPLTVLASKPGPRPEWQAMHFFLAAGVHEKTYTDQTKRLATALKALGIDTQIELLDGKHGWNLWNPLMENGLVDLLPRTADARARFKAAATSNVDSSKAAASR